MSKEKIKPKHKTSVGGEALIEGIMMRGPRGNAMSVRLPSGEIETEYLKYNSFTNKSKFFKIPIIRGFFGFIDSMILGYKSLMKSAEKAGEDVTTEEDLTKFEKWINDKFGEKIVTVVSAIGMVLGIALAFIMFFWLPSFIFESISATVNNGFADWGHTMLSVITGEGKVLSEALAPYRALFEGVLKMAMFIIYIALISRMKEINRVFQYHGAEHKTIFCYENGLDLTVENVKKQSRFHPRCGTSFIFMVLIVSICFVTCLSFIFPDSIVNNRILWVIIKLAFLPILMGIGYELIKFAGRHDGIFVKIISAPGLWMQRLTTKEPTEDGIIEVGIASLKAVITDNPEDDKIQ